MAISEIYTRHIDDPNFVVGRFHHSNAIETVISKVKMILNTRPSRVLGQPNFGVGLEDMVFTLKLNADELEKKIQTQIYEYIPEAHDFDVRCTVQFGKGYDEQDTALIDVSINGTNRVGIFVS